MRALLQRVVNGSVSIDGQTVGAIGPGWVILLGIGAKDTEATADRLAERITHLRGFDDEAGRMNRSVLEAGGSALVVSQFTLYGDLSRGRRASFVGAAPPDQAELLVERFVTALRGRGVPVETGRFRARMLVDIQNEGPVTFWLADD